MERNFDLQSAEIWHKNKEGEAPVNLQDRIQQSSIFSDLDLSEYNRELLFDIIEKNIKQDWGITKDFWDKLSEKIKEFKQGGITLLDLNNFVNSLLEEFDVDSDIAQIAVEIKNNVYRHLKGYLSGELIAESRTLKDDALDKNRRVDIDEGLKQGLSQIREILEVVSKFKGSKITYTESNPGQQNAEDVQIQDGKTSKTPIEYRELDYEKYNLSTGLIRKKGETKKKIEVLYSTVKSEEENDTTVVFKMIVDGKELGFIEYCFEGNGIHEIILRMCSHITTVVDTFIDRKLSEKLQRDIEDEKLKISQKYKLNSWRNILIENCKVLSKILGKSVGFTCNKFDTSRKDKWTIVVHGDNVTFQDELDAISKSEFGGNVNLFDLKINEEGEDVQIGTLAVNCDNPFEKGLATSFQHSTEEILRRREQKRHTLTHAVGLNVANAYLDGNLEPLKKCPVAVLYADIVGFSGFTKDLRDLAKRNDIEESVVAQIIIEFIKRVATQVESKFNVVVDKFVGDELIILCGLPLAGGKDAFGNIESNINQLLEVAQNVSENIQSELNSISHQVIKDIFKEHHVAEKINVNLQFSFGLGIARDLAGMLGDPESKNSRLDYSIIGHDMNLIARILGAAGPNQVLVWKKSWDEYDGDDLVAVGEPYLIEGKNIGLVEVVAIEHKKDVEARKVKQRTLSDSLGEMAAKFRKDNLNGKFTPFTPENIDELPDGIYLIEKDRKPSDGLYKATLSFEKKGFSANIPSSNLSDTTVYVTPGKYEELKQNESDIQFHKREGKFTIVYYKCIEDKISEAIDERYKTNIRLGRKESDFSLGNLLPGEWKILSHTVANNNHHFDLRRRRKSIDLVLPINEKSLKGDPLKSGTLIFDDGVCKCEDRNPNWHKLYEKTTQIV